MQAYKRNTKLTHNTLNIHMYTHIYTKNHDIHIHINCDT